MIAFGYNFHIRRKNGTKNEWMNEWMNEFVNYVHWRWIRWWNSFSKSTIYDVFIILLWKFSNFFWSRLESQICVLRFDRKKEDYFVDFIRVILDFQNISNNFNKKPLQLHSFLHIFPNFWANFYVLTVFNSWFTLFNNVYLINYGKKLFKLCLRGDRVVGSARSAFVSFLSVF